MLKLANRQFHSYQKVTKLLHEAEAKVDLAQLEKLKMIIIRTTQIIMFSISTSLTVPGQP